MQRARRIMGAAGGIAVALSVAACTADSGEERSSTALRTTTEPATSVAPAGSAPTNSFFESPEPEFVATDPPAAEVTGGTADVLITWNSWDPDGDQLELGALVRGTSESGGTCTVTLTREGETVTASVPGEADVSSTACLGLAVAGDQLSPGRWSAVVSYASDTTEGTSAPVDVDVP